MGCKFTRCVTTFLTKLPNTLQKAKNQILKEYSIHRVEWTNFNDATSGRTVKLEQCVVALADRCVGGNEAVFIPLAFRRGR